MREVALAEAVIVVNSPISGHEPAVAVLRHLHPRQSKFDLVFGAHESRWRDNPDMQYWYLLEIMWHLVFIHKIPTDVIHAGLQTIPEYRDLEGNDLRIWLR